MAENERYSMVQECTNEYEVRDLDERETEISIRIPKKFRALWLIKLADLHTTEQEIEEWADE